MLRRALILPGQDAARPVLVTIFLRGGADGLALVPPRDARLEALRPTLRADAIELDGTFSLRRALAPLLPLYRRGELAIVHAIGTDDATRSHFEAQDRLEHGGAFGSGWMARLARASSAGGALSSVAIGTRVPEALRGAPAVSVFERASEHRVEGPYLRALRRLYVSDDAIGAAGRDALGAIDRLRDLPEAGGDYPDDPLGRRLSELARLIRAGAGVRFACVDHDGWDTHFVQAATIDSLATVLARSLAAFLDDVRTTPTTVLVMTEFGRRAYENASFGTDHGRASVLLALGAGVRGGRVIADWPGLSARALEPPGDLRVTIDAADVIAELVRARYPHADPRRIVRASDRPLDLFA